MPHSFEEEDFHVMAQCTGANRIDSLSRFLKSDSQYGVYDLIRHNSIIEGNPLRVPVKRGINDLSLLHPSTGSGFILLFSCFLPEAIQWPNRRL